MTTQRHTTNPTKIVAIPKGDVVIRLVRNPKTRVIERFTLDKLDTSSFTRLPTDARIALIAKARFSEMIFEAGTIAEMKPLREVALSEIDTGYPLHLRIIVFDGATKKILASCERIGVYDADEAGLKSLLPVEPAELGEQMWRLSAEEGERPILQVNSDPNVSMIDKIANDAFCQSLVLPAAIRGVLIHLLHSEQDGDDPDSWQNRWLRYLDDLGINVPQQDNEEEGPDALESRNWVDDSVRRISEHLSLKQAYVQALSEESK